MTAAMRRHVLHPATFSTRSDKPRLAYFRWSLASYPPYNQRLFERLFIRGLTEHFDVVVIEGDVDYDAVCALHEPELALFESGNNNYPGPYLRVQNTAAHAHIPKLGFMRADPMCPSRTTFYGEMEQWGIDTYFTYVSNAAEYVPEVADRLFHWPFAIDPEIYRDYGQEKLLPVLLLGNTDIAQYAWRKSIRERVQSQLQTVVVPHVGYDPRRNSQALYDENFSRLINSARVTPTCGGMVRCLVNKHLEIPASGSLLLTEETPILAALGFRHLENCVFATPDSVVGVLDHLFAHPEEMARITKAGHDFVHAHHTHAQRPQIRQWFELQRQRQSGQRIEQASLLGDLTLVDRNAPLRTAHVASGAIDRALLDEAWAFVAVRQLDAAIDRFRQCEAYTSYMAEPRLGLATCHLLMGQPMEALTLLKASVELILNFGGREPDPIEWATWVIALLCFNKPADAAAQAAAFPSLHRRELDYARRLAFALAGQPTASADALRFADGATEGRYSIHARASRTMGSVLRDWADMLQACGHVDVAATLRARTSATLVAHPQPSA